MQLAQNDIFGTIAPPPGAPTNIGTFTGGAIRLFVIAAGVVLLIYMLWGAFDWISSGGEKERIVKAQAKITQAVVGMLLVIASLVIFNVIAGDVLKIITILPDGSWKINLPSLR